MSYYCIHFLSYSIVSLRILKAFSWSMIRSSFIYSFIFYTYTYLCLIGPHCAIFIPYLFLYHRDVINLLVFFNLLGVKIFLLISFNSASISHSFVLMTLAWSTSLCSVISKAPISLQIAIIRFRFPLPAGSLWQKHLIASLFTFSVHLLLTIIATSASLSSFSTFFVFLGTFLLILILCNRFYQNFTLFPIHIIPFLYTSNPKNYSSS